MPHKRAEDKKEYQRKYNVKHSVRKEPIRFRSWLKTEHGMTPEIYEQMLIEQEFRCAICWRHVSEFDKRLAVDHCHAQGHIRGLLCMFCNTALGKFKDDVEVLARAIDYLNKNAGV